MEAREWGIDEKTSRALMRLEHGENEKEQSRNGSRLQPRERGIESNHRDSYHRLRFFFFLCPSSFFLFLLTRRYDILIAEKLREKFIFLPLRFARSWFYLQIRLSRSSAQKIDESHAWLITSREQMRSLNVSKNRIKFAHLFIWTRMGSRDLSFENARDSSLPSSSILLRF